MIWSKIAITILRYRIFFLLVIVGLTSFMAIQFPKLQMEYGYSGMMPDSDTIAINLKEFKEVFGGDATIFLFGVKDSNFFTLNKFNDWKQLRNDLKALDGIESVFSVSEAVAINKRKSDNKFEFKSVFPDEVLSQSDLDSLRGVLNSLPIYRDLLYSKDNSVYFMVLEIDSLSVDTKARESILDKTLELTGAWCNKYNIEDHYSGLPYVRSSYQIMIKSELLKFIILAALVTFLLLILFFRSLKAVLPSVIVVGMGVLWAFGTMVLLDFKITVLTGMIPPVIIVIGIPNCVFIINKYHREYKKHNNKLKALKLAIEKVGYAVFLTNLTTAAGFATFMVVKNPMFVKFGLVAAGNIMILFVLSVFLIPIIFSFLPPPTTRQTSHLDYKLIGKTISGFTNLIIYHRKLIYLIFFILICLSGWGISKMKTTGFIVDDIPSSHPLYVDLKFFENSIGGVMPLEISVDTHKPKGVLKSQTLKKIEQLQQKLNEYPELSRSVSVVDGLKFARQAYFNGDEKQYRLPSRQEQNFIIRSMDYTMENSYLLNMLIDSTQQKARISMRVADIGVNRMLLLKNQLERDIEKIFPENEYHAILTGSSLTFTLGTRHLVRNLFVSLGLAIILISVFMAWMFSSSKMVLISILPNLLPLIITAGIMGFFSISIRPSTILVFSIAFGISVDTAIHFLAKYRQELSCRSTTPDKAVTNALKEVGVSIIYTIIILFFGFGIFVASEFGGTVAMGLLTSITLFVAMLSNLLLVPSILLGQNRKGRMEKLNEKIENEDN